MRYLSFLILVALLATVSSGCVRPVRAIPDSACAHSSAGTAPLIASNPDGTITVNQKPSQRDSGCGAAGGGLVIPAQIIVPVAEKKEDGRSPSESQ